jgi:hypothetical protein
MIEKSHSKPVVRCRPQDRARRRAVEADKVICAESSQTGDGRSERSGQKHGKQRQNKTHLIPPKGWFARLIAQAHGFLKLCILCFTY